MNHDMLVVIEFVMIEDEQRILLGAVGVFIAQ